MSIPGSGGITGSDTPLSKFLEAFEPVAINTTLQWCHVCNQNSARGCDALISAQAVPQQQHHDRISPVGAGFLGAGLTIVVSSGLLALALALGFLSAGKKKGRSSVAHHSAEYSDVRVMYRILGSEWD